MNKTLIGTIVGGIILFIWGFLSWSVLNLHGSHTEYTAQQTEILDCLEKSGISEGEYFLPNVPPGTPADQHQKTMEANAGKPWATIAYHKQMSASMGMNLFRGFIINLLSVFLLCFILGKIPDLNFNTTMLCTLCVGIIGYLSVSYIYSIWFQTTSIPYLIDTIVSWGLVGAWLGWWLNRK